MSEPKKTSPWLIVLLILGGVLLLVVAIVGALAAMGVYGARRYVSSAKEAEGRAFVTRLAAGIVSCSEKESAEKGASGLPDSAPPVPSALSEVSGKKYQTLPTDWSAPAYTCAGFQLIDPQYFQYEWQKASPTNGKAIARADFDGDGKPEAVFEVEVMCSPTCRAGSLVRP